MDLLPLELKYQILLNVDLETLDSLCQTDKSNYDICKDQQFWIDKIKHDFRLDMREYFKYSYFDPYFQYRLLYITDGRCGTTLSSINSAPCLIQTAKSGRLDMINYYLMVLGRDYNNIYRELIRAALDVDRLEVVLYIFDRLNRSGPEGDPVVDVLKLAVKKDLDVAISLVERYPDLGVAKVASIIETAINKNRLDIVRYLAGDGKPLPKVLYDELFPVDDEFGLSITDYQMLHRAIMLNNYDIVKYVVDKFFVPQSRYPNRFKRSLLILASRQADQRIFQYIKKKVPAESWYRQIFSG